MSNLYRKKQLQEMFPYEEGMDIDVVSVSDADKSNGSPRVGDMIAINPNNVTDMWLISENFFKQNYELVEPK